MTPSELLKAQARPDVFGGKPIIWGMRVSVEILLSLLLPVRACESAGRSDILEHRLIGRENSQEGNCP